MLDSTEGSSYSDVCLRNIANATWGHGLWACYALKEHSGFEGLRVSYGQLHLARTKCRDGITAGVVRGRRTGFLEVRFRLSAVICSYSYTYLVDLDACNFVTLLKNKNMSSGQSVSYLLWS